ncbi:unnamed protein product [Brachionus calyciflorus]|uniref:Uncharacterized protein n=1 Tax=Brachionus calyciflorus TaxID=104777 RepID=A0A813Y0L3_9BILA|nr:unnamed protein product [Brachionus calyciflorus]
MSSNNENQKRRPSESSEIEENKEVKPAFRSIKAFVISKSQKPDNIENNDIIVKSRNEKLLIKLLESPKKKELISNNFEMKESFHSNVSFEAEQNNSNTSLGSFDKKLQTSFEKIGNASKKLIDVVKTSITSIVESVLENQINELSPKVKSPFRTSTPSDRSLSEDFDNLEEEDISPVVDHDHVFLKSEINRLQTELEKGKKDNDFAVKNLKESLEDRDTKICFYENDMKKLQNRYLTKCEEIRNLMEKYERIEEDLYSENQRLLSTIDLKDLCYQKKINDLETQINESNGLYNNIFNRNIELEKEVELLSSKRKCPLDKQCKSEGNICERYKTHQSLNSCPIRKQEIDDYENLKRTSQLMQGEIERLKLNLIDEKDINDTNEIRIGKFQIEIEDLKKKIFESEFELTKLALQKQDLENKLKSTEDLIKKDQSFNESKIEKIVTENHTRISDMHIEIDKLRFEKSNFLNRISQMDEEIVSLKIEKEKNILKEAELALKIADLSEKKVKSATKEEEYINQINDLEMKITNFTRINEEITFMKENLEVELKLSTESKEKIEKQNEKLLSEKLTSEENNKKIEKEFKNSQDENQRKIVQMQKNIDSLTQQLNEYQRSDDTEKLKHEINKFKKNEKQSENKIALLEGSLEEMNKFREKNEKILTEKENNLILLNVENNDLKTKLEKSEDKLERTLSEKNELSEKLKIENEKIIGLTQSINEMKNIENNQQTEFESNCKRMQCEIDSLKLDQERMNKVEKELTEVKKENKDLFDENKRLGQELEKNTEESYLITIQEQYQELLQEKQREIDELNKKIDTEKNLKTINLRLKQEIINKLREEALTNSLKMSSLEKEINNLKKSFKIPNDSNNDVIIINSKDCSCPYKVCGGQGNINENNSKHRIGANCPLNPFNQTIKKNEDFSKKKILIQDLDSDFEPPRKTVRFNDKISYEPTKETPRFSDLNSADTLDFDQIFRNKFNSCHLLKNETNFQMKKVWTYGNLINHMTEVQTRNDPIIGVWNGWGVANGRLVYLGSRGKPYYLTPGLNRVYVTDRINYIIFFEN